MSAGVPKVTAIDGLRGIAVLSVVLYHYFSSQLPGGYIGVDIFFVISGFLITSLMIRERAARGSVALGQFWLRRARRILPAALVVLVVVIAVLPLASDDVAVDLGPQVLGVVTFSSNWVQIAQSSSYFAEGQVQLFAHYWSLAVEEQFYLVWPFALAAIYAVTRNRRLASVAIVLALAALSAGWMAHLFSADSDPTRVYFGSDSHAFGLLIGAATALLITNRERNSPAWPTAMRGPTKWLLAPVSMIAAAGILFAFVSMKSTEWFAYGGGLVLMSLAAATVIVAAVGSVGPVAWALRFAPLRWLGARSYSLYLWHWPVVVLVRDWAGPERSDAVWVGVVALAASLLLSIASFELIEEPLRRRETWVVADQVQSVVGSVRSGLVGAGAATAAVLAVLVVGVSVAQAPTQTSTESDLAALAAQLSAINGPAVDDPDRGESTTASSLPPAAPETTAPPVAPPVTGDRVTVIGDSVALASSQSLALRLPGIYIDAAVSRSWEPAPGIVATLDASGLLRDYVVVALGTNGNPRDGLVDQTLAAIGPVRKVILVTSFADRPWTQAAVDAVYQAVATHPNVTVADWAGVARAHPEVLRTDGVHPEAPAGTDLYADAVLAALNVARLAPAAE